VILIDDVIPNSMKFVSIVMVLNKESISTFISLWHVRGVSITAVKRLMDITVVVDQESQGERLTLFSGVYVFHYS
jgi:hypothetical protein